LADSSSVRTRSARTCTGASMSSAGALAARLEISAMKAATTCGSN
jgi:hypothetical protein